jgi:hypothetical protein
MSSPVSSMNNNDSTTNTISIYQNIEEYKEFMSPNDPNYCKKFLDNMSLDELTPQARKVIETFDDYTNLEFCTEEYSYGDCDDYGPTEHIWTLYVITENYKDGIKFHKYYREVFIVQGDKNDDIEYKLDSMTDDEKQNISKNWIQSYPSDLHNVVYNCRNCLNTQAEKIVSSIEEEVIFVSEDSVWGDCDKEGPREFFWTLYVLTRNDDGTIKHRKYYREVYVFNDDDEDVEYFEISFSPNDYLKKFILE